MKKQNPELRRRWQSVASKPIVRFDVTTLDDVKADTKLDRKITLALRCLGDTRALRARRDYKPCGSAHREELAN